MKMRLHSPVLMVLAAIAVALSFAGCQKAAKPVAKSAVADVTNVNVQTVSRGTILQQFAITGDLAALDKTTLTAKTTGRIVSLPVLEGDRVRAGQVIAQLDPTEALASIRQYEASVRNLQVKVQQAITQYNQSVTNSLLSVKNAKSQLEAAKTALQKTQAGGRTEEKAEALHQLEQQQANLDNAQWAYNREVELYNSGAVAKADLENALTTYRTNQAQVQYYKQNYELIQKGRPEDIATSQQSVRQYQIAYDNAVANLANAKVNRDNILSYEAQVQQAQQEVAQYRQQLADLTIRTPYDGYVASRSVTLGQTVNAGTTIAEVDNIKTTYFEPTVSETDYRRVRPGQPVKVVMDAYPGRTFNGVVAEIYPSANTTARQFTIRVTVPNPGGILRPGMYARGTITTDVHRNVVLVPLTTLLSRDSTNSGAVGSYGVAIGGVKATPQRVVLLGSGNKAISRNVETGLRDDTNAEITSGLRGGETLITQGEASLRDGDPVRPMNGATTAQ
ncbi:MAG: efflux RND transporter periplasmic adaptor subunit [Capsulimonadaceae bacterium]|nr:efflux RND transporter periplasmic adaptor subunit [Capsulimonadaceae bacterium]